MKNNNAIRAAQMIACAAGAHRNLKSHVSRAVHEALGKGAPRGTLKAVMAAHEVWDARQVPEPVQAPLSVRVRRALADRYLTEIDARGGETEIVTENGSVALQLVQRSRSDAGRALGLMRCEGWRYYSRRFGSRPAALAYLCGEDDNGTFAVRVPGSTESIGEALEALEPAKVRAARRADRIVLRQGDVWIVQQARDNFRDLPRSHAWDPKARTLSHAGDVPHAALHVPFRAAAVPQTALGMGRTSRRGRAD